MNLHDETRIDTGFDAQCRRSDLADRLAEARRRTLWLLSTLTRDDLVRRHDPLMSPIIWDVGHIGNFEELWGVRQLPGARAVHPELDEMYDPMKNPRAVRAALDYPSFADQIAYLDRVRAALMQGLESADLDGTDPLVRGGYVYEMILQHEYQHDETMLATLQLKQGDRYRPPWRRGLPAGGPAVGGMIGIPAGRFSIGTDDRTRAYDNERPRHDVELPAFRIGVAPVTNAEFMAFVEEGGYRDRRLWSEEGWAYITDQAIAAPKHWHRDEDGKWTTRSMDVSEPVNPRRPVVHVCWHEAEAYCRFAGVRLPTEVEWEVAASFDPATGASSTWPWGEAGPTEQHANLDQTAFMAAEVGAYPAGVSHLGCHQMIGDVWEWTSTPFDGYPGFEAFPYDEYSRVFFGPDYRVLRGGSWATRPGAIRSTFRNWDYPIRRQIFSGFRVAADEE